MLLVLDIGNSRIKAALFNNNKIVSVHNCPVRPECLADFIGQAPIEGGILSSVSTLPEELEKMIDSLQFSMKRLSCNTPVPIKNLYSTPSTLGMDRLAAAVGASWLKPGRDILIIDVGTAITFDFISAAGEFTGGNISPGKELRFKSLHEHTRLLPLVNLNGDTPLFGYSTHTAIRSGVITGIRNEIEGYISTMRKNNPRLLTFLTGGDMDLFEIRRKNGIFATEYLVLQGLNRIYSYNEKG